MLALWENGKGFCFVSKKVITKSSMKNNTTVIFILLYLVCLAFSLFQDLGVVGFFLGVSPFWHGVTNNSIILLKTKATQKARRIDLKIFIIALTIEVPYCC